MARAMDKFTDELKGVEKNSRTWYFAKPAQSFNGLGSLTKPTLVIQMQRFGKKGQLVETIDMTSVGYFRSLFFGNPRTCHTHEGCTPRFLWTRDMFSCSEKTIIQTEYPLEVIIGSVIKTTGRTYCNIFEWRFCGFEICITMTQSMNGSHDIFIDSLLVARWEPKRQHQAIQSFELLNIKDMSVIAEANQDALTVSTNVYSLTENLHQDAKRVPLVGDDATAFYKTDLIIICTGSWLIHKYFKTSA